VAPQAGYSGTPLPKKLGIKEGARVALLGAPDRIEEIIEPLPPGVTVKRDGRGGFEVGILFSSDRSRLARQFGPASGRLDPDGGLWVAWPKRASGVQTDLDENVVRRIGLAAGLVDNKVCAIDETWSGLRFVYRVADRPPRRKPR
jgi:hypothetical protein